MIEEQQTRFVAAADYTDECRVDVRMRRKHMDLSASQARQFARELLDAADEADRARASVVRPVEPFAVDMLGPWGGLPDRMVQQVETIAVEIGATVVHVEHLSPDCAAGKHPAWGQDTAWDDIADVEVPCTCACHMISSTPGRAA